MSFRVNTLGIFAFLLFSFKFFPIFLDMISMMYLIPEISKISREFFCLIKNFMNLLSNEYYFLLNGKGIFLSY